MTATIQRRASKGVEESNRREGEIVMGTIITNKGVVLLAVAAIRTLGANNGITIQVNNQLYTVRPPEEHAQLLKWQHYAKNGKKKRVRKKYQKKILKYVAKFATFHGTENPWPSAGSDYYYRRHPGGGIWNTPGLRRSPWIPFNGPAAPIFKPEGGKNYD
jgi:hypothetical protein